MPSTFAKYPNQFKFSELKLNQVKYLSWFSSSMHRLKITAAKVRNMLQESLKPEEVYPNR